MTPKTKDQNQGPTALQRFFETKPDSKFADHTSFCAFVSPESLVALAGRCNDARYKRRKPESNSVSAFSPNEATAISDDPILPNEATAISDDPILPNEATATSDAPFLPNEPSLAPNCSFTMSYAR